MALNDLLTQNKGNKKNQKNSEKSVKASSKEVQHSFTLRHDISTKVLLDRIKKLKELTTPTSKSLSQGSIVREALELLAKDMDYDKLAKKYSEFIEHINEESVSSS